MNRIYWQDVASQSSTPPKVMPQKPHWTWRRSWSWDVLLPGCEHQANTVLKGKSPILSCRYLDIRQYWLYVISNVVQILNLSASVYFFHGHISKIFYNFFFYKIPEIISDANLDFLQKCKSHSPKTTSYTELANLFLFHWPNKSLICGEGLWGHPNNFTPTNFTNTKSSTSKVLRGYHPKEHLNRVGITGF